jgi:hypothetical protein
LEHVNFKNFSSHLNKKFFHLYYFSFRLRQWFYLYKNYLCRAEALLLNIVAPHTCTVAML